MIVSVSVRAGAKEHSIHVMDDGTLRIKTTAIPEGGKANKKVREMLADHFNVPVSTITLISGATSSKKRFMIMR